MSIKYQMFYPNTMSCNFSYGPWGWNFESLWVCVTKVFYCPCSFLLILCPKSIEKISHFCPVAKLYSSHLINFKRALPLPPQQHCAEKSISSKVRFWSEQHHYRSKCMTSFVWRYKRLCGPLKIYYSCGQINTKVSSLVTNYRFFAMNYCTNIL